MDYATLALGLHFLYRSSLPLYFLLPSSPISLRLFLGTSSCDIWEVDCKSGTTDILVHGHESCLYGLTVNPAFPHIFATAGEGKMVVVWSAATRKVRGLIVPPVCFRVCFADLLSSALKLKQYRRPGLECHALTIQAL